MTRAFDLPPHLAAKDDPALIGADEEQFTAIDRAVDDAQAELTERLETARRQRAGVLQQAVERDEEVQRLSARLRHVSRFGIDLCLGRMVSATGESTYVGRLGLTGPDGTRLLVDWRTPAAEPFFAATHGDPMGLASRRRYRWHVGRVVDYWDEVFDGSPNAATDADSAFIASLGSSREPRMRDVLATLQADQDAIIRAGSSGALVVDGGPGTGKTVVALHRAAYLTYHDPRLGQGSGGVLFVGPHEPYLAYVADVLPSLGEEGVRTCTLRDLVPEGVTALDEPDPEVTRLKSAAEVVAAVETGVRFYEEPPTEGMEVETPWVDVWVSSTDWAEAFAAPDPGTPHNEAREDVLDALVEILADRVEEDVPGDQVQLALRRSPELREALSRAWPLVEATDLVGDLWSVPAYLRHCAPWLDPEDRARLRRDEGAPWTVDDLPLLDAAHRRLGDPDVVRRRRRRQAELAVRAEQMTEVVDALIEAEADPEGLMVGLRQDVMRGALVDESGLEDDRHDPLAGPFAHVVVDEAQELTDAQWQMLLQRCPSRSFTIVGDRAQARRRFAESWSERLRRVGLTHAETMSLSINYRTPTEVMDEAAPVIRSVLADANVPTSVRTSGLPVRHGTTAQLDEVVAAWLDAHDEGIACVIGATYDGNDGSGRVRSLTPELAKGLEFDLVVLVGPSRWSAVDQYVAMTRATQELVVLT